MDKKLRQGTLCVQAGYKAKNGEPIELPIIQIISIPVFKTLLTTL